MLIYSSVFSIREIFKKIIEKNKLHISHSIVFFPENRAVFEIMWTNAVEPERLQMAM
jgi:hypothetical protein